MLRRLLPATLLAPTLLALAGCRVSLSPLQNRIAFGQEPFLVFAATGEGRVGDLYAVKPAGGEIWPVTYTRVDERLPAIAPNGVGLAFVRRARGRDDVVVMDLSTGRERRALRLEADSVTGLAWRGQEEVWVRTAGRAWRVTRAGEPAPLEAPAAERDSAFLVLLGEPAFASAAPCDTAPGVCVRTREGAGSPLAPEGRDAARWGADSVGYFVGDRLVVRSLGPGRERVLRWHPEPVAPRAVTYFPGP
jgi:hypothetical protein